MTKKVRFNNWTISKWRSGRMVCDVRSIGHKWVWLKQINKKQYTKISRLEWNLSKKQIEEELKCSNYYDESYIKLVKSVDDLKSLLIDLRFEKECR
jgi:hypothetical protein